MRDLSKLTWDELTADEKQRSSANKLRFYDALPRSIREYVDEAPYGVPINALKMLAHMYLCGASEQTMKTYIDRGTESVRAVYRAKGLIP
jgi:hypothetical protein